MFIFVFVYVYTSYFWDSLLLLCTHRVLSMAISQCYCFVVFR